MLQWIKTSVTGLRKDQIKKQISKKWMWRRLHVEQSKYAQNKEIYKKDKKSLMFHIKQRDCHA